MPMLSLGRDAMQHSDRERENRVRRSFRQLRPRLPDAVESFYDRFFAERPDARALFSTDLETQKNHLVTALSLIVKHINDLRMLESTMRRRGARHQSHGVLNEHYPVFRDHLLQTLQLASGAVWTRELHEDWAWAIDRCIASMLRGTSDRDGTSQAHDRSDNQAA